MKTKRNKNTNVKLVKVVARGVEFRVVQKHASSIKAHERTLIQREWSTNSVD